MSRGLKNNNPGNIRKSSIRYLGEARPSQDAAFKQFETMVWGYRAMFVLLDSYRHRGYRTLRQMISRYAPPVENHTQGYLDFVCSDTGLDPDRPIDTHHAATMIPVVAAMSRVENGTEANMADVTEGWRLFMKHQP